MFSLRQLRIQLYVIFKLLRDTGTTLDVVYEGVVYELLVRRTNKKPRLSRPKSSRVGHIDIQQLDIKQCLECGSILVNGICMNMGCPTNKSS